MAQGTIKDGPVNGAPYCAYLNSASTIIGNLFLESAARIDGKVEGDIAAMGPLVIGDSAEITGRIEAPSVMVSGKVNGDIRAARMIEVRAPAEIAGNLTSPILVVEPGSVLDVHCRMSELSGRNSPDAGVQMITLEEPVALDEQPAQQGISLFITRRQKAELRARGYSDDAIERMTPSHAHRILGLA